jgi:hypothetical protein
LFRYCLTARLCRPCSPALRRKNICGRQDVERTLLSRILPLVKNQLVPHLRRSPHFCCLPTLPASRALASVWANLWSRLAALGSAMLAAGSQASEKSDRNRAQSLSPSQARVRGPSRLSIKMTLYYGNILFTALKGRSSTLLSAGALSAGLKPHQNNEALPSAYPSAREARLGDALGYLRDAPNGADPLKSTQPLQPKDSFKKIPLLKTSPEDEGWCSAEGRLSPHQTKTGSVGDPGCATRVWKTGLTLRPFPLRKLGSGFPRALVYKDDNLLRE